MTEDITVTADDVTFRRLADADWDAVVALEFAAYAADSLSEGRESLQSRGGPRRTPASWWSAGERSSATC
ncbi:hypothetical protein OG535_08115 [Kitasatospora sp. NBC_00085]|uniref:hypothetical protein n=1 Tax=unclassified Kitasatospora TaxID=2633591 RepID=UPI003249986C